MFSQIPILFYNNKTNIIFLKCSHKYQIDSIKIKQIIKIYSNVLNKTMLHGRFAPVAKPLDSGL